MGIVPHMAEPNWKNRTIWTGDCLDILRGMNSESVDLIYLDPPFNSDTNYAAPIGSKAAGTAFKDTWTLDDVDRLWLLLLRDTNRTLYHVIEAARLVQGNKTAAYPSMMAQRLLELRRTLKPTGSIYLHCDPGASHYLKAVMDTVFGPKHFRNEIIWHYRKWPSGKFTFQRNHDILLFYGAASERTFNQLYMERAESTLKRFGMGKIVSGFDRHGRRLPSLTKGTTSGVRQDDVWNIARVAPVKRIYITQKPIALLERVVQASSNPGDVVLDPFCGCATACVAAERNDREWIGIDLSERAAELVQVRIRKEINLLHNFRPIHRTDQPHRTDLGKLPKPAAHKDKLYGEQSGQCGGCMTMFHIRNLTIDHIVPRSKGGMDHKDNLWLLCGACNSSKGTKTQEEFLRDRVNRGERIAWLQDNA